MKKGVKKLKLNVKASHSRLMIRNLFDSLVTYGKVETTGKKAKVLRSYADKTLSYIFKSSSKKVDNLIVDKVKSRSTSQKALNFILFLKKQGRDLSSGFTSIVRTRHRAGDNSLMFEVKLIGFEDFVKAQKPERKKVSKAKPAKKVVPKAKKEEAKKKEVKKIKRKVEKPQIEEIERRKDENFFTKLGERFLGRKSKGPELRGRGRARSRSGI